ncbi:hypothetical protein IT415_02190 [bacterium]|nr:hypothetical protein [bacterium]
MLHPLTLFLLMLMGPSVTAVLIHSFSVLNFGSTAKSARAMSRITLALFLVGCIGCISTYIVQAWDLLAVFGASTLLMFLAFARVSLVMVVIWPPSKTDIENVNIYF